VLLVEDSPAAQIALRDLIALFGFDLLGIYAREADACTWLRANPDSVDIVVLDLLLSQGSGFSVLPVAQAEQPRSRIVIFSDFVTPTVAQKCLALGAERTFRKSELAEFTGYLRSLRVDPCPRDLPA
jgi:DNA-binding NarL/FixJ family response regulator